MLGEEERSLDDANSISVSQPGFAVAGPCRQV